MRRCLRSRRAQLEGVGCQAAARTPVFAVTAQEETASSALRTTLGGVWKHRRKLLLLGHPFLGGLMVAHKGAHQGNVRKGVPTAVAPHM